MDPRPDSAAPGEGEWQRADEVFDQALDLEPGERGVFLAEACGGDALLKARVERLLAHASALEAGGERPGEALTGPFAQALAEELESDNQERDSLSAGTVIGRYVLGEEIGRGGMAVVYAARRADGVFEQQVALKVIKRGLDSDELAARFRLERQILAR